MQARHAAQTSSGIPDWNALKRGCRDRRMRAGLDFLLAYDLRQEFQTEELARHLEISTTRVLHLFHEEFELSPAQILKLRRLEEACRLFNETFKRVKEVMAEVGCNDLSHFVRDFKQTFGMTPSQLRRETGNGSTAEEDNDGSAKHAA